MVSKSHKNGRKGVTLKVARVSLKKDVLGR